MANLREIAEAAENRPLEFDEVRDLRKAADSAETMAFDLSTLIDGKDDELGEMLSPIMDFLKKLAGIS